jgi:hypothetical protein
MAIENEYKSLSLKTAGYTAGTPLSSCQDGK